MPRTTKLIINSEDKIFLPEDIIALVSSTLCDSGWDTLADEISSRKVEAVDAETAYALASEYVQMRLFNIGDIANNDEDRRMKMQAKLAHRVSASPDDAEATGDAEIDHSDIPKPTGPYDKIDKGSKKNYELIVTGGPHTDEMFFTALAFIRNTNRSETNKFWQNSKPHTLLRCHAVCSMIPQRCAHLEPVEFDDFVLSTMLKNTNYGNDKLFKNPVLPEHARLRLLLEHGNHINLIEEPTELQLRAAVVSSNVPTEKLDKLPWSQKTLKAACTQFPAVDPGHFSSIGKTEAGKFHPIEHITNPTTRDMLAYIRKSDSSVKLENIDMTIEEVEIAAKKASSYKRFDGENPAHPSTPLAAAVYFADFEIFKFSNKESTPINFLKQLEPNHRLGVILNNPEYAPHFKDECKPYAQLFSDLSYGDHNYNKLWDAGIITTKELIETCNTYCCVSPNDYRSIKSIYERIVEKMSSTEILSVLSECGLFLKFVPEEKRSPELCQAAVLNDELAIAYTPIPLVKLVWDTAHPNKKGAPL